MKEEHLANHARMGTDCILYSKKGQIMQGIVSHSIMLRDINGEYLAEFLVMHHPDNPDYQWVKTIAHFAMHEMYRRNVSNPIALQSGMIMPMESFLGYMANVIKYSPDKRLSYSMVKQDGADYIEVHLLEGMHADAISKLTGMDEQKIRDFYNNYFVVIN